jgi:hypothetical protein
MLELEAARQTVEAIEADQRDLERHARRLSRDQRAAIVGVLSHRQRRSGEPHMLDQCGLKCANLAQFAASEGINRHVHFDHDIRRKQRAQRLCGAHL